MNNLIKKTKEKATLSWIIAASCLASIMIVTISIVMFYSDPRSKYDLVRPGQRTLPESFYIQPNTDDGRINSKDDILLEFQDLTDKLNGLDIYGEFTDDGLSDYKVFQDNLELE